MIHVRIGEGLGNAWTSQGILALARSIKAQIPGVEVKTFGDTLDEIVGELTSFPPSDKVIIGGYSRGADYAPTIAKRIVRPVAYLFQLQPSLYYPTTPVSANVDKAYAVYNPWWFETGGLGFNRPYKADTNTHTQMEVVMAHDTHGGVQFNPAYQSRILRDINAVVKGVQV